jgi:hypothetical protein
MRAARSAAALVLTVVLAGSVASARDIYVDNVDGDDAFTGRQTENLPDRSGPVRTIARALELAATGDRIVLAKTGEPYRESVSLMGSRHSGYSYRPFVIEGNGAILDGSAPVPPEAWEHYQGPVYRFRPQRLAYQQLFLNDRPVVRVPATALADRLPELGPLEWCLYGGYIYFSVEPNTVKRPEDYALSCAHQRVGITLYHVSQVAIANLTVQGFQLDGINAFNTARDVTIAGVTCRGNGRSGIAVGGASQVVIQACLLGDNGAAQLLTLPYSETGLQNTVLLSNTAPGWVDQGGRVYLDGKRIEGGLDELAPKVAAGNAAGSNGEGAERH